jgi:hypothetical protein
VLHSVMLVHIKGFESIGKALEKETEPPAW